MTKHPAPETEKEKPGSTDAPANIADVSVAVEPDISSRRATVRSLLTILPPPSIQLYDQLIGTIDRKEAEFERIAGYAARDILDSVLDHVEELYQLRDRGTRTSLGTLVATFEEKWTTLAWDAPDFLASDVTEQTRRVKTYLQASQKFFQEKKDSVGPPREEGLRKAVEHYRGFEEVPESAYKGYSIQWFSLKQYFNNIGHGSEADRKTFDSKVEEFELLLIDLLQKEPAQDRLEIDAILEEGEGQ